MIDSQETALAEKIQKRASEHFNAMSKDVARGQINGMTKTQIQMRYVIWQMARIEVLYGKTKSNSSGNGPVPFRES